jgi:hypothetical protein
MRSIVTFGLLLLFSLAGEAVAAAQTSKFGIPSTSGSGGVQLVISTVAQLPTCDVSHVGIARMVTDATTPTYNGALVGGGAVQVSVLCTSSGWKSQ